MLYFVLDHIEVSRRISFNYTKASRRHFVPDHIEISRRILFNYTKASHAISSNYTDYLAPFWLITPKRRSSTRVLSNHRDRPEISGDIDKTEEEEGKRVVPAGPVNYSPVIFTPYPRSSRFRGYIRGFMVSVRDRVRNVSDTEWNMPLGPTRKVFSNTCVACSSTYHRGMDLRGHFALVTLPVALNSQHDCANTLLSTSNRSFRSTEFIYLFIYLFANTIV